MLTRLSGKRATGPCNSPSITAAARKYYYGTAGPMVRGSVWTQATQRPMSRASFQQYETGS